MSAQPADHWIADQTENDEITTTINRSPTARSHNQTITIDDSNSLLLSDYSSNPILSDPNVPHRHERHVGPFSSSSTLELSRNRKEASVFTISDAKYAKLVVM